MPDNTARKVRRVGILEMAAPDAERLALWDLFKQGLHDLGHTVGDTIVFDIRWAEGRTGKLANAADELVGLNVDVLVTAGTPAAAAASRATADIPIVMATGVGLGTQMTAGAAARNANVTGISDLPPGVSAKRLQLLREAVPDAPLALLGDRGNPSSPLALRETQAAAREAGIVLKDYWIETAEDFASALAAMQSDGIGGCVMAPGALFFAGRKALAALAIGCGIALIAPRREYAEAGCLMAYGAPIRDNYWQAARYVSQILRGAHPADLPVGEPAEFDLVINASTARALGLALAPALVARAETI